MEYVGGEITDGKITGLVDHFSIYGVFVSQELENESETIVNIDNDSKRNQNGEISGRELPKTATNNYNLIGFGLGLVLIGGIAYVFIRRRAL